MIVEKVTLEDDLDALVSQINKASWDDASEVSDYDADSLKAYLERQDTIFLVCRESTEEGTVLLGIASSRIELKPYGKELWLYVDEVDVCSNKRKRSAGKLIMNTLIDMAEDMGCCEVWLGAEADNIAANALYLSLDPDEVTSVTGYTYETDE